MSRIIIVVCVLSLFVSAQGESPKFCHGLDCPPYTVTHTYKDYELRHYPASKWVGTNITTDQYSHSPLFGKLFAYISGDNAKQQKIEMTAPVLTKVTPGSANAPTTYAMHFMIPFDLQSAPVAPTDKQVYLVDLPALDVYVKAFGGYALDRINEAEVEQLHQEIQDNNKFESKYYFTAGYDSPYTFFNRHNEVWLVATGL